MKENESINICLACDDNYSKYAGVVIASILENANQNDRLSFFILDGGISDINKEKISTLKTIKNCEINFIKINNEDFKEYEKVCTHKYITLATYYRLKLASLLPNINKIIYFDCDVVINSSLNDLFGINLNNNLVAGVKDINKKILKENPSYVNAGMLIFNLDLIRKENTEEKFLQYTIENFEKIKCGDQTIINEVCKNRVMLLDDSWNVQSSNFTNRSSYTKNPKVVHFVAKNKPWSAKSFSYRKNLYFKYLQLTPWKIDDLKLKQMLKSTAFEYFKYRPFFFLRPRFYIALFNTYVLKEN